MRTKLRNDLIKVLNGLDRAIVGCPRDWVSKVSQVSPGTNAALTGLKNEMVEAMGMAEGTNKFLIWFSSHHDKIVEGLGPWKRPSATEEETTALNIAFVNYLGTSRPVMERIARW